MRSKLDPRTPSSPHPLVPTEPGEPQRELRRHPRLELPVRCWIVDEGHTVYLRLHDVSRGGLSVRAPVPFQPHRPVELTLELPSGETVRARGEVVWVKTDDPPAAGSGPKMGARFLEFLEGEEELYRMLGRA
ncbi:MAG TPA: PilZ domain-containing protein [Polyangia bacterium]|jgi:hypothetical protein